MHVVCLDLESVLVPEIWITVAEHTGIDALRLTTRDLGDYDELMAHRLKVSNERDLRLQDQACSRCESGVPRIPGC